MHEFGHAVTAYSADFGYIGESGALNESISDVFALMLKHRKDRVMANSPDADWLIAKDLLKYDDGSTRPLRSASDPGNAFKGHPLCGDDEQIGHTDKIDPSR